MTPSRNKTGQFAPKNPDCEPATKGFVKCIARKVVAHSYHTHENTLTKNLGVTSIFIVSCTILIMIFNPFNHDVTMVGATLLFTWGAILMVCLSSENISSEPITPKDDIKAIQKYEPPKCEQKKECGED